MDERHREQDGGGAGDEPNNGEILAMASNRRYDLNDPRNLGAMYTQEQIEQ